MWVLSLATLAWFVYRPGLSGGYLFDDTVNLDALGAMGPIHDWSSFLRYISSGVADPTGRPLTLLSFLLDANNWPASPYSFKRTNVLLHIANGLLLWKLLLLMGRRLAISERESSRAALIATACWLLHPLLVSTTLYVVQREAMLPLTFVLLGLLSWCHGRNRLDNGSTSVAYSWMIFGAWGCTSLAVLCKANGALLPALLAVVEATVLNVGTPSRLLRSARKWFLGTPIVCLMAYVVIQIPFDIRVAAENRPWSIWQRLITEPRVVCDYLRLLWLPRSSSFGVFNDQFQASTNLLEPLTTLPCLLVIVVLSAAAWRIRKRHPVLSLAALFFLVGLSMECTFIPLELTFEHRNYLPSIFMFWPLALWLSRTPAVALKRALTVIIITTLSLLTNVRAQIWGNQREQALIWGEINQNSPRAQAFAASVEMEHGQEFAAIARLRRAVQKMPNELQITLNLEQAECQSGTITPETWQRVLSSLQHATSDGHRSFDWFVTSIHDIDSKRCAGISFADLGNALEASRSNVKFGHQQGRMLDSLHLEGLLALAQGKADLALDKFNSAIVNAPDRGTALSQAAELGSAGFPELGLQHLQVADATSHSDEKSLGMPRLHAWILKRQHYWENETAHLRESLTTDAQAKQQVPPATTGRP